MEGNKKASKNQNIRKIHVKSATTWKNGTRPLSLTFTTNQHQKFPRIFISPEDRRRRRRPSTVNERGRRLGSLLQRISRKTTCIPISVQEPTGFPSGSGCPGFLFLQTNGKQNKNTEKTPRNIGHDKCRASDFNSESRRYHTLRHERKPAKFLLKVSPEKRKIKASRRIIYREE